MKPKNATKQSPEDPQMFVLGKLITVAKTIRRNGYPEEAEIAAKYEAEFTREMEKMQKAA